MKRLIGLSLLATMMLSLQAFAYTVTISEPAESRAYQRPAQSIDVTATVKPALADGESVHIVIGDVNMGVGTSASLPTTELNPGEHTIKAIVMDKNGTQVASSERVVYVIQNTALQRQRRAQQAEYEAYQNLPLLDKLWLNLHQGFTPPKPVDGIPPAK